ncbi:MAG: tyrosine--tRNA ligase [Candidatus Nealsonbacteria bacterium]|nr:tyrosine--tRNA ligase [Candidatus Nealsonbacteria bacterium]
MTDVNQKKIESVLTRGVDKIYPDSKLLEKTLLSGKRLKMYCGYDPTGPVLHLGHLITIRKLAQFQQLGHEIIMLIGDFTGMIGDPTEKISTRKRLSRKEVLSNAKNYQKQAGKFINFKGKNPAKLLFNSVWLDKLRFDELINLAANFTVQHIMIRDFFQERIKNKNPIFLHEFLYPLAQAYDSVAMEVDLEVGGSDQIFNMLCGRDLMRGLKNKEKFVMGLKLLVDPTGKKMGKTEGNLVSLDSDPKDIYGKIMSWPDEIIHLGFELLTDLPAEEVDKIIKESHPREAKAMLAGEIVSICHDKKSADSAEAEFDRVHREKELPSVIPEILIRNKNISLLSLLVETNLASSRAEAKRLVLQRGVKIDEKIEDDWKKTVNIEKEMVIQVGRRKFVRVK